MECFLSDITTSNIETLEEDNRKVYIIDSKQNIDSLIRKKDYKRAFALLILFIERLNEIEKNEVIDYYSENLSKLGFY